MDIPTLKLAFPTTRDEIISLIDKTNSFLRNLESYSELNVDLTSEKEKFPVDEVNKVLNNTNR
jgi:hypothetical protein